MIRALVLALAASAGLAATAPSPFDAAAAQARYVAAWHRDDARFEGTAPLEGTLRQTALWERRGNRWVLTHEHRSLPLEELE